MDESPAADRPFDLESLLRSPWRRRLAIASIVVLIAVASSLPLYDAVSRWRDVSFWAVLGPRLVVWGVWGVLAEPLLLVARWLRDRTSGALGRTLLLVPFSVLATTGLVGFEMQVQEWSRERYGSFIPSREALEERGRGSRSERPWRGDGPGRRRALWWDRAQRVRLWSRNFGAMWILLAIGAGLETFLHSRDAERGAARLALRSARLEAELARAQLGSLGRQLNPHFLFNALHSIGGLVRTGDATRALAVLSNISALLRLTLEHGEAQEISLDEELAVAERYLALERVRLGERLETLVEAQPEALAGALPALLLLPLVENAVRHGVAPREEGGRVELRAWRENEALVIEVRDDGPGFPDSAQVEEERLGIGLANGRERLALLYGSAAELRAENRPEGGAVVVVRVPWHEVEHVLENGEHENGEAAR